MQKVFVWDGFVRLFHWSLVILFFSAFFVLDDESAAHRYAGYGVLGLVLARLVWGLIGSTHARFSAFPPSASAALEHGRSILSGKHEPPALSHNPLGALMVYNLLAGLLLICASGIMMGMDRFWGEEWVESLHEIAANYVLICVGLHVAGVVFESRKSGVNLLRAMITGTKELPDRSV